VLSFAAVMNPRPLVFSIVFCCIAAGQCKPQAEDMRSVPIVSGTGNRYLRPDAFKSVPAEVLSKLNQRHCLIPQDVETPVPHNVVTGEFAHAGQREWAAYCSVNGKSKVVVIWGGREHCSGDPFGLNEWVDDDAVYREADPGQLGRIPPHGSFWKLSVIPRKQVVARQTIGIAEGELLKSASHDALQSESLAGVSGVYCERGKWRELWYGD